MEKMRKFIGMAGGIVISCVIFARMQPVEANAVSEQPAATVTVMSSANPSATATATAHVSAKPKTKVKVKTVSVRKITRAVTHINLRAGVKQHVKFQVKPASATNKTLRYVSRKPNYVSVSKKGVIKAKAAGVGKLVKIIAVSTDGSNKKCVVTVRVLPKINPNRKMVALTFDDGPNTTSHHQIVDTLKKNNATATFFVLGSLLENGANKNEIKRTYRFGNEIASHTQNHLQLTKLSTQRLAYEINRTDQMIKSIIGKKPELLREPYGAYNSNVLAAGKRPSILWSIDTLDWKTKNANAIYSSVMNRVSDGSIILMHSIHQSTADAVTRMVPALKARGYQIVTVSEMYQYRNKKLSKTKANFGF